MDCRCKIGVQSLLFSIVIPVHNRDHLINSTIRSVLKQTYPNYEITVIDDSSTDNTPAILASYGTQITTLRSESRDPGINRNAGIEIARGDYVVFLDSDDILLPWALQAYADFLTNLGKPPILLAKARGFILDEEIAALSQHDNNYQYYAYRDYLSKTTTAWLSASHLIVRRSALGSSSRFHENTFPFDDLDFILTLGCIGPFVQVQSPVTVLHRVHSDNAVKDIGAGLTKLEYILKRERQGVYPGGSSRRVERLSVIGGHVYHWSRRAVKKEIYWGALRMLFIGSQAIIALSFKKAARILFFRKAEAHFLNRTAFVGGPIQREDGSYGTTNEVLARGSRACGPDGPGA